MVKLVKDVVDCPSWVSNSPMSKAVWPHRGVGLGPVVGGQDQAMEAKSKPHPKTFELRRFWQLVWDFFFWVPVFFPLRKKTKFKAVCVKKFDEESLKKTWVRNSGGRQNTCGTAELHPIVIWICANHVAPWMNGSGLHHCHDMVKIEGLTNIV